MLRPLTPLPVKEIERGEALKPVVVYLAPATSHVSIEAGGLFKLADWHADLRGTVVCESAL
jgi:Chemotaxis response regulator containing a CheY-like receiver domain and a methylesterase domain